MFHIGLMSGTSMDAIDAALVDFGGDNPRLVATHAHPLPANIISRTRNLAHSPHPINEIGELDIELGRLFADAANELVRASAKSHSSIVAIGSHGQTVYHHPEGPRRLSMQLADPNTIAEITGITTVADFRRRDMAAGGQGAPLVPAYHRHVFHSPEVSRVVLNIGGIANITFLPGKPGQPVVGFDTGPGNGLMDSWSARHGKGAYDAAGDWARSGTMNPRLLDHMLGDAYFLQVPPKSTGREYFSEKWIGNALVDGWRELPPEDVQATLLDLTVVTVERAIGDLVPTPTELFVCGGGAHNTCLMERIRMRCSGCRVSTTGELGTDPDWVEAMAFAWLAMRTLAGKPGNVTSVTGARHPVVLGGIYRA